MKRFNFSGIILGIFIGVAIVTLANKGYKCTYIVSGVQVGEVYD